jgi:hypothetical protein
VSDRSADTCASRKTKSTSKRNANTPAARKKSLKSEVDALVPKKQLSELDKQLLELSSDQRVALLRKENTSLRHAVAKREAGLDIVATAFKHAYDTPLDIPVSVPKRGSSRLHTEEAVVHVTDIHFGKKTTTYNSTVAAERLLLLVDAVQEIADLRRSFATIKRLRIELGGDMVEGEGNIFGGQAHEIDQDLIDQMIKFGPEKVAGMIISLAQTFEEIYVDGVPGNHGRQSRDSSKRHNADSIFYEIVRLIVNTAAPKLKNRIKWNLPLDREPGDEWFASFKICDHWGGATVHGDQILGQLGMPWYGFKTKVAGWASCMPPFDYLFTGHFHTHASFDLHDRCVLSTGSTESDNAYAKQNMAAAGRPKQRLVFFNRKYGLLTDIPIHLDQHSPRI